MIGFIALGIFVALQAAVRLAPLDAERWHVDPFMAEAPSEGGVLLKRTVALSESEVMRKLTAVAGGEPRTKRIAGKEDGLWQTYQSRSLLWGFPDYTTLRARTVEGGTEIAFLARLRFGRKDFGVNARRVDAWIKAAEL